MRQQLHWFLLFFFLFPQVSCFAAIKNTIDIVPNCMWTKPVLSAQIRLLAQGEEVSLISAKNLSSLQTLLRRVPAHCRGFMNVTSEWEQTSLDAKNFLTFYTPKLRPSDFRHIYVISERDSVFNLFKSIDHQKMTANLSHLTSYADRAVDSKSGLHASLWLKQHLEKLVEQSGRSDVMIKLISTEDDHYQPSVLLKIGKYNHKPAVILGAHIDTVAKTIENKRDDNASGATSLLEAARVLLNSGYTYNKPLYFVWYAGEEAGKLGSKQVVAYVNQHKIIVDAVLQLDMTGFVGKTNVGIGLADDYTDAPLSAFVADLASAYLKLPVTVSRCGYACSDHIVWYQNGNRVAYPFATMDDMGNPFVHGVQERVEKLNINQIANFAKLSIAFAMELSGIKID